MRCPRPWMCRRAPRAASHRRVPAAAAPRKQWITNRTWAVITAVVSRAAVFYEWRAVAGTRRPRVQVAAEVLRTCFQQEAVTLGALEANTMRQKQCLREDRDAQVSSIARQAQNAADQGDLHDLFKLSKGLGGFVARTIEGVKNKAGVLLVQKPHIDARRAQHFAELLLDRGQDNIPEPSSTFGAVSAGECEQLRDTEDELNYLFGPEAITEVVKYVRARRAAGLDDLPIEVLRAGGLPFVERYCALLRHSLRTGQVPALPSGKGGGWPSCGRRKEIRCAVTCIVESSSLCTWPRSSLPRWPPERGQ